MPSLSATEWRRIGAMTAAIVGLHAAGFAVLFAVIVPRHFAAGAGGAFGAGIGITAYVLRTGEPVLATPSRAPPRSAVPMTPARRVPRARSCFPPTP